MIPVIFWHFDPDFYTVMGCGMVSLVGAYRTGQGRNGLNAAQEGGLLGSGHAVKHARQRCGMPPIRLQIIEIDDCRQLDKERADLGRRPHQGAVTARHSLPCTLRDQHKQLHRGQLSWRQGQHGSDARG